MKAALFLALIAICLAGAAPQNGQPAVQNARQDLDTAGLVARYRQLPACRMRIAMAATVRGEVETAKATLLFRRPDHLRIDWEEQGVLLSQLVHTPRERRAFFPQMHTSLDLAGRPQNGQVWDGFLNPPRSLAALLEPTPADSAVLEQFWLPGLKPAGTEVVEGTAWLRFRGRGAWGARLDLWVSPEDHLIRRAQLRPAHEPNLVASDIRIDVELLGGAQKAVADGAFELPDPQPARNGNAARAGGAEGEAAGRRRALRQRAAANPADPGAARALVEGLQQAGQKSEALRIALELARKSPSPASYQLLTGIYLSLGADLAAINTFLEATRRFGSRARLSDGLSRVGSRSLLLPADRAAEAAAAVESAGPPASFEQRLDLARLYRRAGQDEKAAAQLLAILDLGPADRQPGRVQVEAIGHALGEIRAVGPYVDPNMRRQLAAAVRRAIPQGVEAEWFLLLPLYVDLDDPEAAERVVEQAALGVDSPDHIARVADGYARLGPRDEADRLFRTALLGVLKSEPVQNATIYELLGRIEHARAFLAPIFRELAGRERTAQPFQAAHWLFLAGEYAGAARAYRDYLASPAASLEKGSPMERVAAAGLGARSAREAKDSALADQLVLSALPDLRMLRGDLPIGYIGGPGGYVWPLLDAASDLSVRREFLERLAETQPEALVEALEVRGAAERAGLSADDLRALLRRAAANAQKSPAALLVAPETFGRRLQSLGLARETAEITLQFARQFPARIDPELAMQLALALRGKEDAVVQALVAAVEAAVRLRPEWNQAEASLAQWYLSSDRPARGIELLAGIARRRGRAADYVALAEAELNQRQHVEAGLAHLELAMRMDPGNTSVQTRYGRALQVAGKASAALAWWRGLKSRTAAASQVMLVANGLRSLGRHAEAIALIEARYAAVCAAEGDSSGSRSLRADLVESYRRAKQPAKILPLFPEARLFELEVEPEAIRRLDLGIPPVAWQLLLERFEQEGRSRPALLVYCCALLTGGVEGGDEAYRGLIERGRRAGNLGAARDVLRQMAAESSRAGSPLARAWLAAVEEELGNVAAAADLYRRILHPDGAPYPHAGPGVVRAARGLAALLAKQDREAEAERCRKWAEAFSLLEDASVAQGVLSAPLYHRARALFPESPCIQAAICRQQPPAAAGDDAAGRALELMVPVCTGARACAWCQPVLARLAGPGNREALLAERLIAASGRAGGAYFLIAAAKTAPGRPLSPESRALWRQVVERDPEIIPAWEALRETARQQKDVDGMIEAAHKVANLRADSAYDWVQLANAYRRATLRTDRHAGARAAIRRARELDPGEPSLRWELMRELDWPPPDEDLPPLGLLFYRGYFGVDHSFSPW
jgi:hypothetical protein